MAVKRILTSFFPLDSFAETKLYSQCAQPITFRWIGRFLHFIENIMLSSVFVFPFLLPTLGGTRGIRVPFTGHDEVVSITAVNDTTEKKWDIDGCCILCLNNAGSIVLILIPHPYIKTRAFNSKIHWLLRIAILESLCRVAGVMQLSTHTSKRALSNR